MIHGGVSVLRTQLYIETNIIWRIIFLHKQSIKNYERIRRSDTLDKFFC